MSAASYIGRVGGLAVALGVGTAILTGQGVANAAPTTDGDNSQTGTESNDGTGDGGTNANVTNDGGTNANVTNDNVTTDTDSPGPGKIDLKLPWLSDVVGRHHADDTTPNSVTATSIVKRISDAAKRVTDSIENAADADNTVVRSTTTRSTTTRSDGSSLTDRLAARTDRVGVQAPLTDKSTDGAPQTNNLTANQFVNRAAAVKEWLASPRAVAGRSVDTTPTVSPPTPLWTPPQILAPLETMTATPGTSTTRTSSLLTTVLNVVNPFAGNTPGSPGVDSPLALVLAGAARREIGVESFTPQALLAPTTNSLTYDPDIDLVNGVITGENGTPTGLTFLVVSQPSGGGKVYVNPATGDFTFLPDLSTVKTGGTETFKVVVAEPTAFTSALTGIPVVGGLATQVLILLYQVPVVNVVLSPIIGRSEITEVPITVSEFVDPGDPIAFTVMVPSDDGVMISTNYFPATAVVESGGEIEAPTILNGPGIATAGNINAAAPNTVDGLVPGINELRDAGYNVVTWDPRGEFNSTGILELDSPEFEGQDVKNIISWITDNRDLTFAAMEDEDAGDPWIGMVGGSYGGGIQLVSAAIDDRIDVIVPGIAWHNLDESLYTNEAFKTSYSSLLLLGLVTTGARINPEIYSGIITGAVLGILTPSQRALLERSGPWDIEGGISIPTLLIQGTVDVLFPLQQAILNAENLGTAAEISMIWFCGGHGVCLTMDEDQLEQQDQFLLDNTIAWLNNSLPEADGNPNDVVDIPKFQWVDQLGNLYSSDELPTSDSQFFGTPLTDLTPADAGGLLVIVPLLGGSGPQSEAGFPQSLGLGSEATNAITVPIQISETDVPDGETAYVVGSPHLTFDYSGIGTSRHVYAQLVDTETGLVVGNIVTPVDVTLDGSNRTAEVDMEDIAWTYTNPDDPADHGNLNNLELQIVGSATPYLNFTQYGYINVSNVQLTFPTAGPEADVMQEDWPAVEQVAV